MHISSIHSARIFFFTCMQMHLERTCQAMQSFLHPSNSGAWARKIASFLLTLCNKMTLRLFLQTRVGHCFVAPQHRYDSRVILCRIYFMCCFSSCVHAGSEKKSDARLQHASTHSSSPRKCPKTWYDVSYFLLSMFRFSLYVYACVIQ